MNIFLAAGRVGPAGAGAGIARLRGAISQSILENARESHSEFEASYSSRPRESSSESCRSSSAWELSAWDGMQEGLTERIRRSSPGLRAAAWRAARAARPGRLANVPGRPRRRATLRLFPAWETVETQKKTAWDFSQAVETSN